MRRPDFESIARDYLSDLESRVAQARNTDQYTAELSYRPALDVFFGRLTQFINPDVERVYEPKRQGDVGHPDWRLYDRNSLGVYGFVEAKGLDTQGPVSVSAHEEQIKRYLSSATELFSQMESTSSSSTQGVASRGHMP